jgi:hypothetical protein
MDGCLSMTVRDQIWSAQLVREESKPKRARQTTAADSNQAQIEHAKQPVLRAQQFAN